MFTRLQQHLTIARMIEAEGDNPGLAMLRFERRWLSQCLSPLVEAMKVDVEDIHEELWVSPELLACCNNGYLNGLGACVRACICPCVYVSVGGGRLGKS